MVLKPVNNIQFHYLVEQFPFKDRNRLKSFIGELIRKEGHKVDHINYIFCSDDYLHQLNKSHLKHDTLTDIITFQLSDQQAPALADIYISTERVQENAQTFKAPFHRELHRVIFHGALHLCGYKDKKPADQKIMRLKEDQYLDLYFVSRGTKLR